MLVDAEPESTRALPGPAGAEVALLELELCVWKCIRGKKLASCMVSALTTRAPQKEKWKLTAHFQATLEDLLRLRPADGDVRRDLLVTTDAERADSQTRLGEHRLLAGEHLQHARRAREAIAALADADVEHELVHLQLAHRVRQILLAAHHDDDCGRALGIAATPFVMVFIGGCDPCCDPFSEPPIQTGSQVSAPTAPALGYDTTESHDEVAIILEFFEALSQFSA